MELSRDGSLKMINKHGKQTHSSPQETESAERAKRNDPAPAPIYEA